MKQKRNGMKHWGRILLVMVGVVLLYQLWLYHSPGEIQEGRSIDNTVKIEADKITVPILMFHHLDEQADGLWTMKPETFETDLQIIRDAGYQPVSMQQLVDYVYDGKPLPEKPVCITFDDGYLSNYTLAYPILKKYQMKATIFAIGRLIGYHTYEGTGVTIIPHFSYEQACEMMDSGWIEVQSHTYNMHQSSELETHHPVRESAAPLPDETEVDYIRAMQEDSERYQKEFQAHTGKTLSVLAYPKGAYSELTEQTVHQLGYSITLTTDAGHKNQLCRNKPQSLYQLGRMNVSEMTTAEELLTYLADGMIKTKP